MSKLRIVFVLIFTLSYFSIGFAKETSLTGKWITIDDKTGKKRAIVELIIQNAVLRGTIIKVFPEQGDTGKCSHCEGEFKNKPIEGLTFVWGLHEKRPGTWDGGRILDPKTGKIYRVRMTRTGDKLFVRGYVGTSLLGRTQIWLRQ